MILPRCSCCVPLPFRSQYNDKHHLMKPPVLIPSKAESRQRSAQATLLHFQQLLRRYPGDRGVTILNLVRFPRHEKTPREGPLGTLFR